MRSILILNNFWCVIQPVTIESCTVEPYYPIYITNVVFNILFFFSKIACHFENLIASSEIFFCFSTYKDTEGEQYVDTSALGHQPVLTFHCDPYVQSNIASNSLPDIVISGVLLGVYKS